VNAPASCVVVGAGRIGCGYVAERLRAAGFGVTLVTRTAERAEAVNRDGSVRVRLLGRAGAQDTFVGPLEAVPAEDRETVTRRIARSSLVAVSVGSARLPDVAPVIAPGLAEHAERINVLVFENEGDAGSRLRSLVAAHGGAPVERHGYAGALVDRIVTAREDDVDRAVRFVAESRIGAVVDTGSLRAPLPRVIGIRPVEDYRAHVLRKLYVFSAGHAAAAYLGALHGHRVIAEALDDPEVLAGVLAAMAEGQAGLAVRYGPAFPGGPERRRAELARFRNPALGDTIDRVGRDPIRKLGAEDRIVGPALLAASGGTPPITLAVVAAAAIVLGIQDVVLSRQLSQHGVPGLLEQYAGIPASSPFARLVDRAWTVLHETRSIGATLATLANEPEEALPPAG
jgi:mannitol-1-phosphate 5-dehydrogenase